MQVKILTAAICCEYSYTYGGAPLAKKLESRIRTGDDLLHVLVRYLLGWCMILVMFE